MNREAAGSKPQSKAFPTSCSDNPAVHLFEVNKCIIRRHPVGTGHRGSGPQKLDSSQNPSLGWPQNKTNKQTKNKWLKRMNKVKSGDRTDSISSQLYFAIIFWYSQLQIVFLTSSIWTKESVASITRHTFCRHPFWKKYIYLTSSFVLLCSNVMISSYFHKMSELSFTLVNFIIVLLSLLSRK